MTDSTTGQCLIILLDLQPVWWASHCLPDAIQSVLVLANAHILQNPLNHLCVYGYMNTAVSMLYPDTDLQLQGESLSGKFEGFDAINTTVLMKVKDMILDCDDPTPHQQINGSLLSTALIKALCYSKTVVKHIPLGTSLECRILIVKGSPECQTQYMAMMNGIFAAQKSKVVIDTCILGEDSTFLQQGSDITNGTYIKIDNHKYLTQYLLSIFLMPVEFRKTFNIPPPKQVDYRAACQCHSKLIDIGYVCSVCMSVYCTFRPMCITCNAHFKLPAALSKSKKSNKRKENGKSRDYSPVT